LTGAGEPSPGANAPSSSLTLADRLEIQELIARYCWALDTRDGDAYAATFVPDGVFDGVATRARGHDELRALPRALHPDQIETQHWVSNLVLEGDAQRAIAKSYVIAYRSDSYYLAHYRD
jgi:uncharacterized protein (TIGR02246 family)